MFWKLRQGYRLGVILRTAVFMVVVVHFLCLFRHMLVPLNWRLYHIKECDDQQGEYDSQHKSYSQFVSLVTHAMVVQYFDCKYCSTDGVGFDHYRH